MVGCPGPLRSADDAKFGLGLSDPIRSLPLPVVPFCRTQELHLHGYCIKIDIALA